MKSLGSDGALLLVFDDPNAYAYVEENRSGCRDALVAAMEEQTGKTVGLEIRLNESGQPGEEIYPDLGELIQFEIEDEDF